MPRYPISIRVWGIVSFCLGQGLTTTFNQINGSQLHTFFVYIPKQSEELQVTDRPAMESNSNSNYESPLVCIVYMDPEGVLCNSNGNEPVGENDGIW